MQETQQGITAAAPDPLLLEPHFPDFLPTIPRLLDACRRRFADHDCVVTPDDRITFAELDERSRRLAGRLLEAGVSKGSRVGILFPNGIQWVLTWAAAARVGAVTVPVNTFYKAPELGRFLRHADVQFLVGVGAFLQHDYLASLETLAPDLSTQGPGPLWIRDFPQLRRILLWGDGDPTRPWAEPHLAKVLANALDGSTAAVVDALGDDVTPGDDLFVTYTSGSTGEPKGVIHSHGGAVRQASNLAVLSGIDESSRIWTPMPLCWVGGFEFSLLRAMVAGGSFLTQAVFEPGAALKMFEQESVTNVSAWPGIAKTLCEHPDFPGTDLSALRTPTSLYDAMPPDRRPPDPGLAPTSLGMSETCGPHTFWTPREEVIGVPEEYRGAFGHEVPGTQHRIVDPETGTDLPEGQEGEVLVRGYSLMTGLYKHERSEVFDADGWYHTGDRGYFRDGWFFFTGRQTDLIKTGGSNVAPAEVERCLLAYEEVKLAFVVGLPDPVKGQIVTALVVPWRSATGAAALTADTVRSRLREELSSYKVPADVLFITDEQVPWLVSQKVDRRALLTLAEKLLAGSGRQPQ